MRYYAIVITNPAGKVIRRYTSFPNGQTDMGALDIELDIMVQAFGGPASNNNFIRIWGIPLADIAQAGDTNKCKIDVYGGMQKGLPLANAAQAGLLASGSIIQSWGNWIGPDMTLDILFGPDIGNVKLPKNLALDWKAGVPLGTAVTNMLKAAYPGYTVDNRLKASLTQAHDEPSVHPSLNELNSYLREKSIALNGGSSYTGVDVILKEKGFVLDDGSSPTKPIMIAFNDLIGQPTWLGVAQVSVTCVMRGDLYCPNYVQLPKTQFTVSEAALPGLNPAYKTSFQGIYKVQRLHHVGHFRQPDGASWVTVLDCYGTGSLVGVDT